MRDHVRQRVLVGGEGPVGRERRAHFRDAPIVEVAGRTFPVEMRYRLMPYIYAQAKDSSERGLPMLRAMSADTMKMPDPIMEPTTTMVES